MTKITSLSDLRDNMNIPSTKIESPKVTKEVLTLGEERTLPSYDTVMENLIADMKDHRTTVTKKDIFKIKRFAQKNGLYFNKQKLTFFYRDEMFPNKKKEYKVIRVYNKLYLITKTSKINLSNLMQIDNDMHFSGFDNALKALCSSVKMHNWIVQ